MQISNCELIVISSTNDTVIPSKIEKFLSFQLMIEFFLICKLLYLLF
jgi:hypothetical protein